MINKTYFHLSALRGSITNGVTNSPLTAVQDNVLSVNAAGQFLLPEKMQLRAGFAFSVGISRMRINTPSLRYIALPYIAPVNTGLTVASPPNVADYGENGPMLPPADSLVTEGTHATGAPEVMGSLLWLRAGFKPATPGQLYRIRLTGAITAVAGTWVSGNLTPDQTLPSGVYDINGLDAFGTNLVALRLIFPGGGYRPGCLARNAVGSIRNPIFQDGSLGCYGTFDSVNLPTAEIYAEGANTVQEVYMDAVRIGDR